MIRRRLHDRPDRMPHAAIPLFLTCALGLLASVAARAQTVVAKENVRLEYAQVLSVDPVYQTLRATRVEQQCDPVEPEAAKGMPAEATSPEGEGRISRMVDSVKDFFGGREDGAAGQVQAPPPPAAGRNCRMVQVEREFRRPIAYDVDYVWKGTKYRSRLAEDPGNRLRIRVAVSPYLAGQPDPAPGAP